MGILLLLLVIMDLLSTASLVIAAYLFHEWYERKDILPDDARWYLAGAIALLLYNLFGRFLLPLLFSKRRKGDDVPRIEHSPQRESIERPDGTVINAEYFGKKDGPPIIFVHGWNANSMEWYYQRKFFEAKHRIILMDLPGLGRSTRPNNRDFSLQKMARDLNAVIEHTGAKNPILWGHSIGGMVILELITHQFKSLSGPVKGIILEHTTFTDPTKTSILNKIVHAIKKPVLFPFCYLMVFLSPIVWLMRWMSYLNGHMQLFTRFATFTGTQSFSQLNFISLLAAMAPPSVFARGMLGMFKTYDVTNELPNINTPTLIIAANKDRLTKPDASTFMHQQIKGSRLVTATPAGHQGLVERHEEVNVAAAEFLHGLDS
jgi:pimeloyl-ACP methyl ester carboxylesterase